MQWNHLNPVQIISGIGVYDRLSEYIPAGAWLLITTTGAIQRGVIKKLMIQFGNDHDFLLCETITPNPEISTVEALYQEYKSIKLRGIIAVGGGSVIDAAKILSVILPSQKKNPLSQYIAAPTYDFWHHHLPVIAIPTTAGTGSEVTPFATLWEKEKRKKYSITGFKVYPEKAILDPRLTLSLTKEATLFTGLDATSHALESIWNKNKTPLSEIISWNALEIIAENFSHVLLDPLNINARERMQYASLLAGLAISQTRTAIAHSISYPLTYKYDIPHGLAASFTLPFLINENLNNFPTKNKPIALKMKYLLESFDLKNEINKYIRDDLSTLFNEMFHPGRSDNYTKEIDIKRIITNSR